VDTGQVAGGLVTFAWGLMLVGSWRWYSADDERIRRAYAKNWWLERRRAQRRGMTKDEWLDRQLRVTRSFVRWVGAPILALYLALSLVLLVHGIRS
jgi:hypothetical protein